MFGFSVVDGVASEEIFLLEVVPVNLAMSMPWPFLWRGAISSKIWRRLPVSAVVPERVAGWELLFLLFLRGNRRDRVRP